LKSPDSGFRRRVWASINNGDDRDVNVGYNALTTTAIRRRPSARRSVAAAAGAAAAAAAATAEAAAARAKAAAEAKEKAEREKKDSLQAKKDALTAELGMKDNKPPCYFHHKGGGCRFGARCRGGYH
jgi:uncharacterized membrane protein